MDRTEVIQKLREHEAELNAAGVVHLRLHRSTLEERRRSGCPTLS